MSGGHYRDSIIRSSVGTLHLPTLVEERTGTDVTSPLEPLPTPEDRAGIWKKLRRAVLPSLGLHRIPPRNAEDKPHTQSASEYDSSMVDVLDTVGTWPFTYKRGLRS